jgi:hypothetical protein
MLNVMCTSGGSRLLWGVSALLAVACGTAVKPAEGPAMAKAKPPSAQVPASARPAPSSLYAADEALRDALSGPWEYVGTGPWPGNRRAHACAFRNERVLVVNAYCTTSDVQAFRVDVFSPRRGRVRIYAESSGAVSAHARREYFTFMAESEPPPGPEARLPALSLSMSFPELRDYDEKRYAAFLPACYGGTQLNEDRGGCLGALAPRASEWAKQNRTFLAYASDDWHRVVREMRALAVRYGRALD